MAENLPPALSDRLSKIREEVDELLQKHSHFRSDPSRPTPAPVSLIVGKRVLYTKFDAIREEIAELGLESVVVEELKKLERDLTLPRQTPKSSVGQLVRMILLFSWLFLSFPPMAILSILRFLNTPLRDRGFKNNTLPTDYIQRAWAHIALILAGIQLIVIGEENADKFVQNSQGVIGLFQHSSNLDAFVVIAATPIVFRWIAKKSIMLFNPIGWLGFLYGASMGIDRNNRAKAVQTLEKAADNILKKGRSLAISPEGTRSETGQLAPFKKGAFHLALNVKVPLLPIISYGAYDLWPKGQLFTESGTVVVSFQEAIMYEDFKDLDHNQLLQKTRQQMLTGMENYPNPSPQIGGLPPTFWIRFYLCIALTCLFGYLEYQAARWMFSFF